METEAGDKVMGLVVKSALRVVKLADLSVDQSYQREVKTGHKSIVSDFNEEALGVPLVGQRSDGSLWVVDGLQRVTALKKLGRTTVRAEVFASKGGEHEAEVFRLVNLNRTKLTVQERFRALLASHDPMAWKVKEAVESCGYKLRLRGGRQSGGERSELTCISTLMFLSTLKGGMESIKFALLAAKEGWPGDLVGTHHLMVSGLAIFYGRHEGVVDLDRLYPRLRTITPQKVLYAAGQASISGNKGHAVADVLEKVYRKRYGKK